MKTTRLSRSLSRYTVFLFLFCLLACVDNKKKQGTEVPESDVQADTKPFFKLSLAQWSLHRFVREEHGSPFQFAPMAKELGFEGLEYVSQLYHDDIEKLGFDTVIDSLKTMSERSGMRNVLIMIDDEGDLADPNEAIRNQAVENH